MKKVLIDILKKYKLQFLKIMVFIVVFEITRFLPAKIVGEIIDIFTNDIANDNLIITKFAILFLSIILYCICRTGYKYFGRAFADKMNRDIENNVFQKFLNLKLQDMQKIKNGELMSYIIKYTKDIRSGVIGIIKYGIRTVFTFIVLIFFMANVNSKLTLIVMGIVLVNGIMINILKQKVKKAEAGAQKAYTKMSEFVQESTDSIRTTKVFTGEEKQIAVFKEKSDEVQKKYIKVGIYSAILYSTITVLFGICYGIVALYGTNLIIKDIITVGEFIAFNSYIKDLYWPLSWISKLLTRVKKMQVGIEKLEELYKFEEENLKGLDIAISGDIEIKNLNFEYSNNVKVLNNINLTIKQGETLGVIGTIGSGKTTLANLLLKLYEIKDNQIFIGGKDINKINIKSLRKSFCYITQENFLFSTSIKDNINLFDESFQNTEILKSIHLASFNEDLSMMKDGLETLIGEKGITLSGGQRQRVAIARAFLFNKNFVIFDDTFSALDNKTEKVILKNLKELLKNKTAIIISNRISDVKVADKIIVLDQGKIKQTGTHEELMNAEGLYKEFYKEQSSNSYLEEINID